VLNNFFREIEKRGICVKPVPPGEKNFGVDQKVKTRSSFISLKSFSAEIEGKNKG